MEFKVEELPFLYSIEEVCSWSHKAKGLLIAPDGVEYRYEELDGWKRYYDVKTVDLSETIGIDKEYVDVAIEPKDVAIKPEVLFHNLSLCGKNKPFTFWFERKVEVETISNDIIQDLMRSDMVYTDDVVIYDAPRINHSLFIYDGDSECYKQILLSSTGYRNMHNNSLYTESILQRLQKYCIKR